MELSLEILAHFLAQQDAHIIFSGLKFNATEILELQCYKALRRIREIICDDTIEDAECFERIERIVCVFEEIGSDGGNRHDFG